MAVPRRRHSKTRRDKARTHKKLHASNVIRCEACGEVKRPHRICPKCGDYKGEKFKVQVTS